MTDEDVGTAQGNWISNAAIKAMPVKLRGVKGARLHFGVGDRFEIGPHLSLWGGLSLFRNESYALFGHDGQSHVVGPLEASREIASETGSSFGPSAIYRNSKSLVAHMDASH